VSPIGPYAALCSLLRALKQRCYRVWPPYYRRLWRGSPSFPNSLWASLCVAPVRLASNFTPTPIEPFNSKPTEYMCSISHHFSLCLAYWVVVSIETRVHRQTISMALSYALHARQLRCTIVRIQEYFFLAMAEYFKNANM